MFYSSVININKLIVNYLDALKKTSTKMSLKCYEQIAVKLLCDIFNLLSLAEVSDTIQKLVSRPHCFDIATKNIKQVKE